MATETKQSDILIQLTEDPMIQAARNLIAKTIKANAPNGVKTAFEVVGVICAVVEATSRLPEFKETLKGQVKAELAIKIASIVIDALYKQERPLISKEVYDEATKIISDTTKLTQTITGVIAVAKAAGLLQTVQEEVSSKCGSIFSCFK